MSHPILLYDGVCGLCNRFVQFILRRDRNSIFRFASLQSSVAARILARHGVQPADLDTVYLVLDAELSSENLLARSAAVLYVLGQLTIPWRALAAALTVVPRFLRDLAYNAVARHRYRIFGRSDVCTMLRDVDHKRFLDQ
jgi:predicted DCC family thiol-disulfide oxidoreductase YuxK